MYNSVPTADRKLDNLSERINYKIDVSCNSSVKDNDLHCHIVSKNDVIMAVKRLKSDKSDVEGRVLSNNYIHGTVWGQNYDSISKLQKRVIRTFTHSNYIAHSEPLLKDLNLLNVKDLID